MSRATRARPPILINIHEIQSNFIAHPGNLKITNIDSDSIFQIFRLRAQIESGSSSGSLLSYTSVQLLHGDVVESRLYVSAGIGGSGRLHQNKG